MREFTEQELVRREKLVELEIFLVSVGYNIYKYHNKKYRNNI